MVSYGSTVLEKKVIAEGKIDCSDIVSLDIFLTKECDAFVLVDARIGDGYLFFPKNMLHIFRKNDQIRLNAFVENNKLMLPFVKTPERYKYSDIEIYDIQKGLNDPITSIEIPEKMQDECPAKLIAFPQTPGKYNVFYSMEKFSIEQSLVHMLSGGHGAGCRKPYLADIMENRVSKYKEIKYGGERIENFITKESLNDGNLIHFLGLRQEYRVQQSPSLHSPFILYYAGYDVEKKEVTQTANIYEIAWDPGSHDFGPLSMTCQSGSVFVSFPWKTYAYRGVSQNNIQKIRSDIYYFQYFNNIPSDTSQIGRGFLPQVRLDSHGTVYVFWVDYSGNLICKTREGNMWSKEQVILSGIDLLPQITFQKYIAVEFDNEDNLHLVYPSNGKLVYEKRTLFHD
jgi:hypothetical protein